jgi:4-hydroxyacetophenone monooxygenase
VEFSPTDEQAALRDSVQRFVSDSHDFNRARAIAASEKGFCKEQWSAFAELGWLSLMVPQDHGGVGASIEDATVVMEEFGKGLVAAPFLSTAVLAVELIDKSTGFEAKASLLERIMRGQEIVALACEEPQSRYDLTAVSSSALLDADGTYTMTGRKIAVLDGSIADAFIVSAHVHSQQAPGGLSLFLVPADSAGLSIRKYRTIDGRRAANLTMNAVRLTGAALMAGSDTTLEILSRAVDRARVLLAAEALGAMSAAMSLTAAHLKTRRQFGRPLCSFQVLTHQLSNMFVKHENARSMVLRAISTLDLPASDRAAAVSAAMIVIIQAGEFVGGQAIQLHGGIGMAEENAVGHHYKRLRAIGKTYGDHSFHIRRYLEQAGEENSPQPLREDHAPERADTARRADIRRALEQADANVLRLALYQATGDASLATMRVESQRITGGLFVRKVLAAEHHAAVKDMAYSLLAESGLRPVATPDAAQARHLMETFTGETLSDNEYKFGLEELTFDEFPRSVSWNHRPPAEILADYRVVIIGAGMCGLMAAIQCQKLGIPYLIFERQRDLGGTWELNNYPEARVDVSSFLYQFKFEKRYPWAEYFASQSESKKYLTHIAKKYGVFDKIRFNSEVTKAVWDEDTKHWQLEYRNEAGVSTPMTARTIISASGLFSTPRLPDIRGIERFGGKIFHTTAWDHGVDLAGKRVALIGNGSTGTQLMPHVARSAKSLTVYQRTPQWVMPVQNYRAKVSPEVNWLFNNVPNYWNWHCFSSFLTTQAFQYFQYHDADWIKAGGSISKINDELRATLTEYISQSVHRDPALIAKCVPKYAPTARRMVVDNGWYEALTRDNVELVTEGILEITEDGIESGDGVRRQLDLIILAAGFEVSRYFWPVPYVGSEGRTLEQVWSKDGPRAFKGVTIPGFPNFFAFYGPNSQPRTGGIYTWAEIWSRYVGELLVGMIERRASTIECRTESFIEYNARLDEELGRLIWHTEGQGGYHVRDHGRSVMHAPWLTQDYHHMLVSADFENYVLK